MYKRFSDRLAALEALEVEAENQLPAVATMTDEAVLIEVLYALQNGLMYCWYSLAERKYWLCAIGGLRDLELQRWYEAMRPRVQPLLDAHTEAIAQLEPPNNGDGRITSAAVATVLTSVWEETYAETL